MSETCKTCLAFEEANVDRGLCRRYAPYPPATGGMGWPSVAASDWCLQHRQNVAPFNLTFIPVDRVDNFGGGDV